MASEAIELVVVTPERSCCGEKAIEVQPCRGGRLSWRTRGTRHSYRMGSENSAYHDPGGKESAHLAMFDGFAEVLSDRVTVLAETPRCRRDDLQLPRCAARAGAAPASNDLLPSIVRVPSPSCSLRVWVLNIQILRA